MYDDGTGPGGAEGGRPIRAACGVAALSGLEEPSSADLAFARVLAEAGVAVEVLATIVPPAADITDITDIAATDDAVLDDRGPVDERVVLVGPGAWKGVALTASVALAFRHEPVSARLAAAVPGAELAELLALIEPADLDDHALLDVAAAAERQASWAAAVQARAVGEMLARESTRKGVEDVGDALAAELATTRAGAARRVALGSGLAEQPELADALAAGVVDRDKAHTLATTGHMPDDVRRRVIRDLLPKAHRLTHRQLEHLVRKEEIRTDPDGAASRHGRARDGRCVTYEPAEAAMAHLSAYLPADQAATAWAVVDQVAHDMRAVPGEPRTLDQCRADAVHALITGAITVPGVAPADAPTPQGEGGAAAGAATATPSTAAPAGLHLRRTVRTDVHVTLAVAASTLAGLDDAPAILGRHGPVPADLARRLAGDGTWRRLLTDPSTGILTDFSTDTYRPGTRLRRAVQARDVTCTFPGCRMPAHRAELDHIAPYRIRARRSPDDPGQTRGPNLHPLCKHHHDAKTRGVWRVHRDEATGATTWTSDRTGHRYVVEPHVADPALPPGGPPHDDPPLGDPPRDDPPLGDPPF